MELYKLGFRMATQALKQKERAVKRGKRAKNFNSFASAKAKKATNPSDGLEKLLERACDDSESVEDFIKATTDSDHIHMAKIEGFNNNY